MTAFPLATCATKDRRRERLESSQLGTRTLPEGREPPPVEVLSRTRAAQTRPAGLRGLGQGSSWVGGVEGLPYFMIVQVYLLEPARPM